MATISYTFGRYTVSFLSCTLNIPLVVIFN
jgi:hypothetical protein